MEERRHKIIDMSGDRPHIERKLPISPMATALTTQSPEQFIQQLIEEIKKPEATAKGSFLENQVFLSTSANVMGDISLRTFLGLGNQHRGGFILGSERAVWKGVLEAALARATRNRVSTTVDIMKLPFARTNARAAFLGELLGSAFDEAHTKGDAARLLKELEVPIVDRIGAACKKHSENHTYRREEPAQTNLPTGIKRYFEYLAHAGASVLAALDEPSEELVPIPASPNEVREEQRAQAALEWKTRMDKDFPLPTPEFDPKELGPVFLWIGIGRKKEDYAPWINDLTTRGLEVHCVDWPPFDKETFNFDHHPDFMKEVMEKKLGKDVKAAFHFGHSRGGLALLKFAEKYPDLVRGMLVASAPAGFGEEGVDPRAWNGINTIYKNPRLLEKTLAPVPLKSETVTFLRENKPKELFGCYLDHCQKDWRQTVRAIPWTIPIVCTWGEKDGLMRFVGRDAPREAFLADFVDFPDTGHKFPEGDWAFRLLYRLYQKEKTLKQLDVS